MLEQPQVVRADTEVDVPLQPRVDPVLVPFLRGRWLDKKLHFHLLEFARTEDEIAGSYFVAEALTDLSDAEGRPLACRRDHIGKVDEDALRGLGSEIVQALF